MEHYPIPPFEFSWATVTSMTDTADDELVEAQPELRNWLSSYSVANSSGTDTIVEFKSASTVIWRVPVPAGGGANLAFDAPIPCTHGEALNVAALNGLSTIYVSANGYISPK